MSYIRTVPLKVHKLKAYLIIFFLNKSRLKVNVMVSRLTILQSRSKVKVKYFGMVERQGRHS